MSELRVKGKMPYFESDVNANAFQAYIVDIFSLKLRFASRDEMEDVPRLLFYVIT